MIGALATMLVASFGLAGCGRKGPLDPPPGASLAGVAQPNMPDLINASPISASPIGGQTGDGNPGVSTDGQALAPKMPHKRIPLDVLLN